MNAQIDTQLEEQRNQWNAVAGGWDRWWSLIEASAQALSDRMVKGAGIDTGHTVLDVATGIGEPAVTAARRVGPTGQVLATDQAANMLDIARRRAEGEGLTHLETRTTNGMTFEFEDGSFDAALCRWGLMFFPAPGHALSEIRRVLKPGGRTSLAVWSTPMEVPMLSLPMGVLGKVLDLPPPPTGRPGPFALADTQRLRSLLVTAGFEDVQLERVTIAPRFASPREFTNMLTDVVGPIQRILAGRPEAEQRELLGHIERAAQGFAAEDGSVSFPSVAILATASRPVE